MPHENPSHNLRKNETNYNCLQTVVVSKSYMYSTFKNGTCRLTMGQYKMGAVNYFMACTKKSPYAFPIFKA